MQESGITASAAAFFLPLSAGITPAPISNEALRIVGNAEQLYENIVAAKKDLRSLPSSLYWLSVKGKEYLYSKQASGSTGKSQGPRTPETEGRYADYQSRRQQLSTTIESMQSLIGESMRQYKSLRLPRLMSLPGKILRALDIGGQLGTELLVVGTNAMPAYEIEARERFALGLDETEDFDLAWCRGAEIALTGATTPTSLMSTLKSVDDSFKMGLRKYQAVNRDGYEVELLAAPSMLRTMPPEDTFSPIPLPEQEWLLKGRPIRHLVADRDGLPAPLVVPDPRWMALHKLWLSRKPSRNAAKRDKDGLQGILLLDVVARKMANSYPMDANFVLDLDDELRPIFNLWAAAYGFVVTNSASTPQW